MGKHSPTPWFLGEAQLNYSEWGFDGTIVAPPSAEEQADERVGGPPAEPFTVARNVDPVDAAFICRACNNYADLLAACEALLADVGYHCDATTCECGDFDEGGECCHTLAYAALAAAQPPTTKE